MSGGPDCSDHPDPESDNDAIDSDEVKKNHLYLFMVHVYRKYMQRNCVCNCNGLSSNKSLLPSPICEFRVFSFMKFLSLIQHNRTVMVNIPQKTCSY